MAGLGCGGNSRLGLERGGAEAAATALVRQALDLGLNFFDTAASYGTEGISGQAIKTVPRDRVVLATKGHIHRRGEPIAPARVVESLEHSLRRCHVVPPAQTADSWPPCLVIYWVSAWSHQIVMGQGNAKTA